MLTPQILAISWILDYIDRLIYMYGNQLCRLEDIKQLEADRLVPIAIEEMNRVLNEEKKKVN
jgi:hypothetical protein